MMTLPANALRGSYPPVVTPFRDGRVDFDAFAALVDRQVRLGSHGIVVTGTTGEPSSLTQAERIELCHVAVRTVAGRVPVVAATGSQSHAETLELTLAAEGAGADAVLVVTPYYIRPSQAGLVEYFVDIGRRTALPLLVYHIPGRAAVSIAPATLARIGERLPTLVGVKHAFNDLEFVTETLRTCGRDVRIFCGLEALSFPMLAMGAAGTMNAVANIAPQPVAAMCEAVFAGNLAEARRLHDELFELNQAIFYDTNPVPLKYMLGRLGLIQSTELRLPLVPASAEVQARCDDVLRRAAALTSASLPVA